MLILVQTEILPGEHGKYQFVHSYYRGFSPENETVEEWLQADGDRLRAAIVNVGKAVRWLYDRRDTCGIVGIQSDEDGKDKKYNGEHDILYSLLFPMSAYHARKDVSLYAEYKKYLGKIKTLSEHGEIKIGLYKESKPFAESVTDLYGNGSRVCKDRF